MVTPSTALDPLDDTIEQFYVTLEEARRKFKPVLASRTVADEDPSYDRHTEAFKKLIQSPSFDEEILDTLVSIYTTLQHLHNSLSTNSNGTESHFNTQTTELQLIVKNCLLKGKVFVLDLWTCMISLDEAVDFKQPCVAQCYELTLRTVIQSHNDESGIESESVSVNVDTILHQYVSYQKRVLRSHCKTYIAQLVTLRREIRSLTNMSIRQYLEHQRSNTTTTTLHSQEYNSNNTSSSGDGILSSKQPHADTLSNILAEASHLIHPLASWIQSLHHPTSDESNIYEIQLSKLIVQTCRDAIHILDKEGQALAVTVGNWLLIDYGYISDPVTSRQQQHTMNNNNHRIENATTPKDKPLSYMDSTLDEMSFLCQVISRYRLFLNHIASLSSHESWLQHSSAITFMDELFTHLQEVSLFYATTEIELIQAKFSHALKLATPIDIVLGKQMYVPSIVEDGYYITTRAIERAHATMCNRALSMVIHFICELWSLTLNNNDEDHEEDTAIISVGAIYTSLINRIGCKEEHFHCMAHPNLQDKGGSTKKNSTTAGGDSTSTFTGGFATALLDALDNDDTTSSATTSSKPRSYPSSTTTLSTSRNIPKAPSSGGSSRLRAADLHPYYLDSRFCILNGIQSASTACHGLVTLLDSITDEVIARDTNDTFTNKQTSMLDLSKAELQTHSKSYFQLLENYILDTVFEYLGRVSDTSSTPPLIASLPSSPPFYRLYYNLTHEMYNLDVNSFQKADNVKRLDDEWIEPLRVSRLVRELLIGKCDARVHLLIAKVCNKFMEIPFSINFLYQLDDIVYAATKLIS